VLAREYLKQNPEVVKRLHNLNKHGNQGKRTFNLLMIVSIPSSTFSDWTKNLNEEFESKRHAQLVQ